MMDKEELLFQMFKDTVETGSEYRRNELQKKYPDVKIGELHIRIVNYQVKKYGKSLNSRSFIKTDYLNKRKRKENGR